MIPRYQTEAMKAIWSDEAKFKSWLQVEIAHLEAQKQHSKDLGFLKNQAQSIDWSEFSKRVAHFDSHIKHDVIAFLRTVEEQMGEHARFLHRGLTSSDIVDTAFALLLKKASEQLLHRLLGLVNILWLQANKSRGVLCLGRTHGQAAEPTTFGIKLLGHLCELARGYQRLKIAADQISVGKLSGAVGVYAHTDPEVEKTALQALGLKPETIGTQVVARDRHAEFFCTLAIIAGSVERLAVEFRLLMHGQVQEAYEPFAKHQQGSSAMPHKKNPIGCENISGLMRLVRSYAVAALENQALWHERDISHSSVERVIAPDATTLLDFALDRLTQIVSGLVFDSSRMSANVSTAGDALRSQALLAALLDTGLMRSEAYELVQQAAQAISAQFNFKSALQKLGVSKYLSESKLDQILLAPSTVPHEDLLFDRAQEMMKAIGA